MPGKSGGDRVAKEVTDTLVKDDGVTPDRAKALVTAVLADGDVEPTDALQIYRAARRRLSETDDEEDDGRPTLELGPRAKPARKGTKKDTPVAKKERGG